MMINVVSSELDSGLSPRSSSYQFPLLSYESFLISGLFILILLICVQEFVIWDKALRGTKNEKLPTKRFYNKSLL